MDPVKKFLIRHRSKIIIVMSLFLILLALGNILILTTVNPTSNDECLWVSTEQADTLAIKFSTVKTNGVTWNAGIRNGDYLLQ